MLRFSESHPMLCSLVHKCFKGKLRERGFPSLWPPIHQDLGPSSPGCLCSPGLLFILPTQGAPCLPFSLCAPHNKRTNAHVGSPSLFLFWDLSPWSLPCSQSHHTAVVVFSAEGLVRCKLQSQKQNPHWFHVDVFPSGLFPMHIYISTIVLPFLMMFLEGTSEGTPHGLLNRVAQVVTIPG